MERKPRLLRITTVPISLKLLLRGQLSYLQTQGFEVLAVSASGPETNDIVSQGIPHISVPLTRKITPVTDIVCLIKLIIIIRKFRPDIVHSHTPKAGLLGMLAAWCCAVPVRMHTVAGLPWMEERGVKRQLLRFIERITHRCAHRVYPNSLALKDFIEKEFGDSRKKMKVLGNGSSNGIDVSFFSRSPALSIKAASLRKDLGIEDHTLVFCFVGRIVKDKGIQELVSAFSKLSQERPAYLILVGPLEEELDPLPDKTHTIIQKSKNIITPGFQPDVRPYLLASDIFVFPSYREGFPNVVMQACAMQIPCIVTDINGCNEIITHRKTGLIVRPKDENSLYEEMTRMADSPQQRQEYAASAHTYVVANFSQQVIWAAIVSEYYTLMSAKTSRTLN